MRQCSTRPRAFLDEAIRYLTMIVAPKEPGIDRTTPVLFGLFSLITLWANSYYTKHAPTVRIASWYRKSLPTFSDALANIRRPLWTQGNLQASRQGLDLTKVSPATLNTWIDMACYAA
jgi:hypothetical protein